MSLKRYFLSMLSIGSLVTLLWLNSHSSWQSDWTFGSRNTLSSNSIELLKSMQNPVEIYAFFDSDNQTRLQLKRFIEKYQHNKKDISLHFVDNHLPAEQLKQLGFTQLGQLKVQYQDRAVFINRMNEEQMTSALYQVSREQDTWAAIIQGHGEKDPYDESINGLSKLSDKIKDTGLRIQPINLTRNTIIPDNTQFIIIAGARSAYLENELKLIEDFINQGGNLLWLRDPARQNNFNSIDEILDITPVPGVIIDANTKLRVLLGIKHAAVIPVTQFYRHKITRDLETHLLFPFASALKIRDQSEWQTRILFKSLDRSWSEVGELDSDQLTYEEALGDTQGPQTLGISLTRNINGKSQRVVVIGDSDFMANGYIGNGANFSLSLNLLNWLAGDDALMSIAHQHAPDQAITLNDNDVLFISLILLIIVPAILITSGIAIHWLRHRH